MTVKCVRIGRVKDRSPLVRPGWWSHYSRSMSQSILVEVVSTFTCTDEIAGWYTLRDLYL